jgi:hypothetical protein
MHFIDMLIFYFQYSFILFFKHSKTKGIPQSGSGDQERPRKYATLKEGYCDGSLMETWCKAR